MMEEIVANPTQESKKELYTALAKAQAEMDIAGKNSANPFFKSKYADFTEIVRASRPALSKYGLSVLQKTNQDDQGRTILITKLCHSSGQYEESIMVIPAVNDLQKFGSALSYAKRYSYAALVGVVVGDEDDDGETAVSESRSAKMVYNQSITKDQENDLQQELVGFPDLAETILKKLKITYLANMRDSDYIPVKNWIRDKKRDLAEAARVKGE